MIRRATEKDFDGIFAIMSSSVTPPWSEENLRSAFDGNSDFFVADEGGVVGYVCFENVLDEACLSSIAVKREYRRRGIAKALVCEALRSSKMKSVYLEVNENNAPALALYKVCGFGVAGQRKRYYGEDTAVIMRRDI